MKHSHFRCLVSAALLTCLLGTGCGTPPAASPGPAPGQVERVAIPATVHDRGEVRVVARASDGTLWGLGSREGSALLCWNEEGWRKVESVADLPGSIVALAADSAHLGCVVSLWSSRPEGGGEHSVLHLYRHGLGRERVRLASFANNVVADGQRRSLTPGLTVAAAGDCWLSFRAPQLLRVPAQGGEPELIDVPRAWFTPMRGLGITRHFALRVTPEARGGEGWLWSVIGEASPAGYGALFRPARLRDGRLEPCPPISGLPETGWVTCIVSFGEGRTVWALEEHGLWEVDLAAGRATPLATPPGAWRILDYARPVPGVEVALTVSPRRSAGRLSGDVWIRCGQGEWRLAGPSGDVQSSTSATDGWLIRPRAWAVVDGLLLGAPFNSGVVGVDLREEAPVARTLDWRSGLRLGGPRDLFALSDGRVLVQGSTATVAPAAEWRRLWAKAVEVGEDEPGGIACLARSAVRASDGRLWALHSSGRGAPCVQHWDGERWRRWSLPPDRDWWPEEGFMVEAASGRVVVTGEGPKTPAWELDDTAEGGWRRFSTVLEWLALRADSGDAATVLPRLREGYLRLPAYGPRGRVLIGWSGALWLRRDGEWRMFSTRELGFTPWRYGFDETGEPWFSNRRERRRLLAGGGIGDPEPWRDPEARDVYSHARNRPGWIDAWSEGRRVDAVHPDEAGVWWLLSEGELWAARERKFVRVFLDEEASPFRAGEGGSFTAVQIDARGHRLFLGSSAVLLPALPAEEISLKWRATDDEADRVALVSGGGRAEWRLDSGSGAWRPVFEGRIELRELPPGGQRLEVRGEDARLCPTPPRAFELTVAYDAAARTAELIAALRSPVSAVRSDAIDRLVKRGATAEAALHEEWEHETDDERRWWLRAALQAVADERRRSLP